MQQLKRTCLAMTLLATGVVASTSHAADAGITVNGAGEAKARPTSVEINATVGAEAELTADAVVKFNDARKKALAALEGLKMAGLTIQPGGMSVSAAVDAGAQMRMMNGNGGTPAAAKTRVAEDLKLVIGGVDKLKPQELADAILKLIDTGRDAGLAVGPKTPSNYYEAQTMAQNGSGYAIAQFRLDDASAARDQAYQTAIQEARKKAEKLASLAGVTLGPVVSVAEANGGQEEGNLRQMIFAAANGVGGATPTATSPKFTDISVKVTVTVQYAIAK